MLLSGWNKLPLKTAFHQGLVIKCSWTPLKIWPSASIICWKATRPYVKQSTRCPPLTLMSPDSSDEKRSAPPNVRNAERKDYVSSVASLTTSWTTIPFHLRKPASAPQAERTLAPSHKPSLSLFHLLIISPTFHIACSDKILRICICFLTPGQLQSQAILPLTCVKKIIVKNLILPTQPLQHPLNISTISGGLIATSTVTQCNEPLPLQVAKDIKYAFRTKGERLNQWGTPMLNYNIKLTCAKTKVYVKFHEFSDTLCEYLKIMYSIQHGWLPVGESPI